MNRIEVAGRLSDEGDPWPLCRVSDGRVFEFDLLICRAHSGPGGSDGGMAYTGKGLQAGHELIVEVNTRFAVFVAIVWQVQVCHGELPGRNKGIDCEPV